MNFKPFLGLLILAVPVALIWFFMRKSRGRRTGEGNHGSWQSGSDGGSDGGADGSS
jgi:hypothetical protein